MIFSAASVLSLIAIGASAKVVDVDVGKNGLAFTPEAIFADVGDQVVFHFHPKNHTVSQSSFADPCTPVDGGINSGFMPVPDNSTDAPPTFALTVNDTSKPLWFLCDQAAGTPKSHCGAGMIFSINCPADPAPNSFANFKKKALAIGAQLQANASTASASSPSSSGMMTVNTAYPGTSIYTAAYGSATVPPPASVATVTQTISANGKVWTSTYGSYPGSPDPTPNAQPATISVKVGADSKLAFSPAHVAAKVGDVIEFTFVAGNHTVTQSSFPDPCRRQKDASGSVMGFNSDFQFVGNSTNFKTVQFTVNDTAPAWFYCQQAAGTPKSHCGAGMVFAINSDENGPREFAAFQSIAKQLNGTAAADTTASSTGSAAGPAKTNGAGFTSTSATAVLGAVVFAVAALL